MKTLSSFIGVTVFFIVACGFSLARSGTSCTKRETLAPGDTVKFYAVSLTSETRDGKTTYQVDNKQVSKAEYDKYHAAYKNLANCKPCYMRTYTKEEVLLNEGDRYTDCQVGTWKEFYPDGQIKVLGQFRADSTGKWKEKKSDKWCSIREGEWTYYNATGAIDSAVHYVNNVRLVNDK
jgi:antitoxin component YwqK of YwqJK toxin-antitoxin module